MYVRLEMDGTIAAALSGAAERLSIHAPPAPSLAGHDALVIGRALPAGMLLLANPTGISHAADEGLDPQAFEHAAAILIEAVPGLGAVTPRGVSG